MGLIRWLATRAATSNATRRAEALHALHLVTHSLAESQDDLVKLGTTEWISFARDYYRGLDPEEIEVERLSDRRRDIYLTYITAFIGAYRPPQTLKWHEPREEVYVPRG